MISVKFDRKRSGSGMFVVNVPARGFDVADNKTCRVFWRDGRTLLIDAWPHDIATVISENGIVQFTVIRRPDTRKSA
jgi:hypothetical protein